MDFSNPYSWFRHIPSVALRAEGKIPTTAVTNEITRNLLGMTPAIGEGQVFPPRVTGEAGELPTGQYQGMFYGMIAANTAGFSYPFAVSTV